MNISKNALRQLCKYGIAGGIGACIDFGLYSLLISFTSFNYLLANAISFSIGTLAVYYLQKNWTFQHQSEKNAVFFTKFLFVVILTYIFNNIILIICVEFLQINPIIAKLVQIVLSFIWGYTINKKFVFK
ncbi:GtrA family protein [Methanoregula sp.]|uniref:GtrA family protein n=1 Tax=Methanoregula sp. TaxID=2052170 RepID=UPI003569F280